MKRTRAEQAFTVFNVIFLLFVVIICVYPIYYVLVASISNPTRISAHTGILTRPLGFTLEAYKRVFQNPSIAQGYQNTLIYVVLGTAINIVMSCIGAYVLSLQHLVIHKALTKFVIFTMFFSGGMIPMFLQIRRLGMIDSMWAIIIPSAINTYNMLIMRTSFLSIPASLQESAKIDGASDTRILLQIILPLSKPIIATMVLYYGVANWNSWFNAMVYLRSRELYPIQLILREILITSNTLSMTTDIASADILDIGHTIQYATIIVVTLPILLVYPFLQKYFVHGLTAGAVKG
ncbi:carbohydrate ABC transporter permease [Ruminococcaceae bacterium OttesenSCG-928-L11]|nr:carbohydrate ABC transporter permease [Ruminococcaceae bacterium OttesenSCG-928-L11]